MNRDPYLPLTETVYYTLVALLEPCHGYRILQKVKDLSNGQVHLAPGTLYGALENLEKQGLITLIEEVEERKKIFEIAPKGQNVLLKDQQRMIHMASLLKGDKELQSLTADSSLKESQNKNGDPKTNGLKMNDLKSDVELKKNNKENPKNEKNEKDEKDINRNQTKKKKREEDLFY